MNQKERRELSKGLSQSLKRAGVKQATPNRNYLNEQLFRYFGSNVPIMLEDNSENYIKNAYQLNADVYSVISQMTRAASCVPPIVHEVVDDDAAQKYYRLKKFNRNGGNVTAIKKAEKLKKKAFIEAPESDLAKLIDRPNPLQAFPEFLENLLGFKFITGNGYAHGVELTDGRIGEMWVMPSQYTRIMADEGTEGLITGYILDLFGYEEKIPSENVMHVKYWNPNYSYNGSHLYGMSPLMALRYAIRNSNDGQASLSKAFKNMGAAGMVFPDDPDAMDLTQEQRDRLQKDLEQRGTGPDRYKSFMVTTTKMGYVPFGMSPVDMEVLAAISDSRRVICNAYGFPSVLLNDAEKSSYNNVSEARKALYMDIVIPELERVYAELNRWLVPRFNAVDGKKYHIDYDVSGIEALAEDMKLKAEWLNTAWWLSPNVKSEEMDFEPVDDPLYDEPWINMSTLPASIMLGTSNLTEEELKALRKEYEPLSKD